MASVASHLRLETRRSSPFDCTRSISTKDHYDGIMPQSCNSQPAPGPITGAPSRKEQRMKATPRPPSTSSRTSSDPGASSASGAWKPRCGTRSAGPMRRSQPCAGCRTSSTGRPEAGIPRQEYLERKFGPGHSTATRACGRRQGSRHRNSRSIASRCNRTRLHAHRLMSYGRSRARRRGRGASLPCLFSGGRQSHRPGALARVGERAA